MFVEEAKWVQSVLESIPLFPENNRVANLGSSTKNFRTKVQPHIHDFVIEPLELKGWNVVHIDYKVMDGVDIVADLTKESFANDLKNCFALTISTNMLEHVENITLAIENLVSVTLKGGYILLTVPYKYKLHYDPIDNGFRPTPEQIFEQFPNLSVRKIKSSIIIINDKKEYKIKKSHFPLWGSRERIKYYLGKRYKVSGILLEKL